jgi:HSP20 family protein
MAITRWEREGGRFPDRMRLFEDFLRGFEEPDQAWNLTPWAPPVDIFEKDGNLVVKVEAPGVRPEDINVHLENNTLTVRGERKLEEDVQREHYHRIERTYGRFTRSFTLPPQYDQEKVQAEFKDGVLRIVVPVSEKARPRQIPVAAAPAKETARIGKSKEQREEREQEREVAVTSR